MNRVVRIIQIPERLDVELRQRAKANGFGLGQLVVVALTHCLDDIDDPAEDERRWAHFEQDGNAISPDAVESWIESRGTAAKSQFPSREDAASVRGRP